MGKPIQNLNFASVGKIFIHDKLPCFFFAGEPAREPCEDFLGREPGLVELGREVSSAAALGSDFPVDSDAEGTTGTTPAPGPGPAAAAGAVDG